ncbi:efflux RND transporter periplasmic adaptor subunit [Pseudoalteromonas denitrificans]|uniref:Membrane fusion protein, multidrug efflux system n=1 Tax=Pseudoalteromonas denitrificans DSM 6059 TaxID=1123010 RepID=A0A1I1HKW4_9GAMM|nr:efflux RND transporter periplasmic adaptor subunit [Pseudoalteromonas denitrificans]SFC22083.1 membrane fusion protein, multidrug efflux system [Pseudoalteromonas denitrificans DSM 6059]
MSVPLSLNKYNKHIKSRIIHGALITSFAFSLIACGQKEQVKKSAPPAAVSVYQIKTEKVGNYREFVARTQAHQEAEIKARVEGELLLRHFNEGAFVNEGQALLEIDPAEYKAGLVQAQADLKSKQAGSEGAKRDLKRGKEVAEKGFISQSDLDKLTTNAAQTAASVKAAEAALEKAKLNLSYTKIVAPFSGQIGKVNYNVGNIIGPQSNALATLTAVDPIYVNFQVEEADYITYLQKNKNFKSAAEVPMDLALRLPNNSEYGQMGKLDFSDTKIDQGTGTVELRAVFANPEGIVLPGLFVTLIVESQNKKNMSLVPQAAVQENQQGKFVLVVSNDNKVITRHVKLGRRINAMWVVESGLKENERVIIEGLQKVKQGVEVNPIKKSVDAMTGVISTLNVK